LASSSRKEAEIDAEHAQLVLEVFIGFASIQVELAPLHPQITAGLPPWVGGRNCK
jgi:hypothetical protein